MNFIGSLLTFNLIVEAITILWVCYLHKRIELMDPVIRALAKDKLKELESRRERNDKD